MHIVVVEVHPANRDLMIVKTPPDLKHVMGRFEAARYSETDKAYLVHTFHLDALGRFFAHNGVTIMDTRQPGTAVPPGYHRGPHAALKCDACGHTQRDCDRYCGNCRTCHACATADLRPHIIGPDEQREINARGNTKVKALHAGRELVKGLPE